MIGKWISGKGILEEKNCEEFVLVDMVQSGVKPYNQTSRNPIFPPEYRRYADMKTKIRMLETKPEICYLVLYGGNDEPYVEKIQRTKEDEKCLRLLRYDVDKREKEIASKTSMPADQYLSSWKNIDIQSEENLSEIYRILKLALYKRNQVDNFFNKEGQQEVHEMGAADSLDMIEEVDVRCWTRKNGNLLRDIDRQYIRAALLQIKQDISVREVHRKIFKNEKYEDGKSSERKIKLYLSKGKKLLDCNGWKIEI